MLIRAKACGHEELAIADEESLADGHKGMMVCILHEVILQNILLGKCHPNVISLVYIW